MKKLQVFFVCVCVLAGNLSLAQSSEIIKRYIAQYKDAAIEEMIRTGVPAAIKLAQGIHETAAGTSKLAVNSNNHFGIKCKSEWKGEWVSHDDDAKGECFRKYVDPSQSYRDHSDFLKTRAHYASLFKLDPTDYEGWAYGLRKAGYATNPKYAPILIKLIKDYNLQEYTLIALNKINDPNAPVWVSAPEKEYVKEAKVALAVSVAKPKMNHPKGVFTINDTKVIVVEKGTSFLKVADEHHISLARLFDFNEMTQQEFAEEDQLIFLQRKRKTGAKEFHFVEAGETINTIAQLQGIRKESLMEYNHLKEGMQPTVGEKLYLTTKAPAMPRIAVVKETFLHASNSFAYQQPAAAVAGESEVIHTVQVKETMFAIAKKYEVEVEDLLRWNELTSADLKIGQQIRIYKRTVNAIN